MSFSVMSEGRLPEKRRRHGTFGPRCGKAFVFSWTHAKNRDTGGNGRHAVFKEKPVFRTWAVRSAGSAAAAGAVWPAAAQDALRSAVATVARVAAPGGSPAVPADWPPRVHS